MTMVYPLGMCVRQHCTGRAKNEGGENERPIFIGPICEREEDSSDDENSLAEKNDPFRTDAPG